MSSEYNELQENLAYVNSLIYGNWLTQVTYVFAELGIADALIREAKSITQLAEDLQVNKGYLKRFLRCAANLGFLFYEAETGLYQLSSRGQLLGSDHPQSKREEARLNGSTYRYQPWGYLLNILKSGTSEKYSPIYQKGTLHYLKDKPSQMETFHKAMASLSKMEDYSIISHYPFARFSRVMDIGSGEGTLIKAILENEPHIKGWMYDLHSFDLTKVEKKHYGGRLIQKQGDFFDEIPDDADLYIMKHVIHNWPEDKALKILENVKKAILSEKNSEVHPIHKRLLIIENVLTDDNAYNAANWQDLNFMILLDGRERTIKEHQHLASKCGFSLQKTIQLTSGKSILEFALTHWQ